MLMKSFLQNRESTRDFRSRRASRKILAEIEERLRDIEEGHGEASFRFKLHEIGGPIYKGLDGKAGYSGVMIESPHYISLSTDNTPEEIIYGAYAMERIMTELYKLNLGVCWVTLDKVDDETKREVLGEGQENARYMLAIGYGKLKNPFEVKDESTRKSIDQIVFKKEIGNPISHEELEERGLLDLFFYIRYAPSTKNLQPWKFVIDGNIVTLYIEEANKSYADTGIIMYYFEELAKILGVRHKWTILNEESCDEYCKMGTFEL